MKLVTVTSPGGLSNLKLSNVEDPGEPKPGELRVRVHATSLNFHDHAVVTTHGRAADGRIPMSDGGGVVEAIGTGVQDFKVGDHVVSRFFPFWDSGPPTTEDFALVPGDGIDGFAAEVVVRPSRWFTRAPKGFTHAESATLTTAGLTAWRALVVDAGLKAGDTILVLGTGGVSIFALQFAKLMGARVIATSSSDKKLERLKKLGADFTINYRSEENWGCEARKWTGGRGVDHVLDVVGPATLSQSAAAVRPGGHISLIGNLSGISGDMPIRDLTRKQVRLQGLITGNRMHQEEMIRAIESTDFHPIIDREFALAELAEAFRYEESGAHFGKICVTY